MKPTVLAPLLLVLALGLFAWATVMGATGGWAWMQAAAEAAAVGALADWFAVVVLFRRPLGLPIPHTAILPANKARMADGLATFVTSHFLDRERLLQGLGRMDAAWHLGQWLQHSSQVPALLDALRRMALEILQRMDDAVVQQTLTQTLTRRAQEWNVSHSLAQILRLLTRNQRHQEVLNLGLQKMSAFLTAPKTNRVVAELIESLLKKEYPKIHRTLASTSLANPLVTAVAEKLSHALMDFLQTILNDPQHPQRKVFSHGVADFLRRLQQDPGLQKNIQEMKNQWVQSPEMRHFLGQVWIDTREKWVQTLSEAEAPFMQDVSVFIRGMGEKLQENAPLRQSINHAITHMTQTFITPWAQAFENHISRTLQAWDDAQWVRVLERHIGPDLQYIRINGTLVGALLGLGFYALEKMLG